MFSKQVHREWQIFFQRQFFKQLKIELQRHFRALLQHKVPLNQPASLLILQFQGICVSLRTWFFIASCRLSRRCLWKGLGERWSFWLTMGLMDLSWKLFYLKDEIVTKWVNFTNCSNWSDVQGFPSWFGICQIIVKPKFDMRSRTVTWATSQRVFFNYLSCWPEFIMRVSRWVNSVGRYGTYKLRSNSFLHSYTLLCHRPNLLMVL